VRLNRPNFGDRALDLGQLREGGDAGLAAITSLPRRIASMASAARSRGMAAVTTTSIEGSSSSRSRSIAGTPGNRLRNPASTRGSVVSGQWPAHSCPAASSPWVMS
jgi:hypothetical protein